MIDVHCHILPGIDDGSRNIEESKALISEEMNQGIDTIIFTPHFYAQRDSVGHFLEKRANSFSHLQSAVQFENMNLRTFLGAEVYYFGGIGKAEMVSELCVQGTDLLLLEMPFCQWTKAIFEDVKLLVTKRNFTVILAHVERYFQFQKDSKVMRQVLALPLIVQLNAGSFLEGDKLTDFAGRKKKKQCLSLLAEDRDVLLGSDAHNMTVRKPNLKMGRAVIGEKIGTDRLDRIDSLGERLLGL
ncbi:capsular polysaccharide biosynthesis protein [Kineothrix sp. MSJ-39]|uniref:CpsB/CapC family capsule biosynthesis tyrosine phosphatase n=1 Tax=Kineothrix sp. MSJ-39 TaxID=2841533 RepID=UPI001C10B78F|nr:CpsB/CapC family capsule biosynthesis tyrosine phosphatase [Kineothrix sp. MSJ-39]MBU5430283.1 capsular polysaccharide biosynthesis protein [Kineothrix sp. MSJ-39]